MSDLKENYPNNDNYPPNNYPPNNNYQRNNYNPKSNLPNATAVLVLGIIAIVTSFCYGIGGIICGIIGLVLSNKDIKLYQEYPDSYSASSYSSLNAGRVCSIIGLTIGSIFFLILIFYFIIVGSFFTHAISSGRHI
jgi:hypothetical protein